MVEYRITAKNAIFEKVANLQLWKRWVCLAVLFDVVLAKAGGTDIPEIGSAKTEIGTATFRFGTATSPHWH